MNTNKLSQMLVEAFEAGYVGLDREEAVTEILTRFEIDPNEVIEEEIATINENPRIYTVAELKILPVGTTFEHSSCGKCTIVSKNGVNYMTFDNPGLVPAGFSSDTYPWDAPMKRLS